ncbi:MAG: hypothetical protein U0931_26730 [Vulcanimicrobiota bacterium]
MVGSPGDGGRSGLKLQWIFLVLLPALLVGESLQRTIDYDEFTFTHSTWLVSLGKIPCSDFLAVHPPLSWYLYLPFFRYLPKNFDCLLWMRIANDALSCILLWALLKLIRLSLPGGRGAVAAFTSLLVVFFQPAVVGTLAECRIDNLSTAALLLGLVLYADGQKRTNARTVVAGTLVGLSWVLSPKLALLPLLVIGLEWLLCRKADSRLLGRMGLAVTGALLGLGLGFAYLKGQGIVLGEQFQFSYQFHSIYFREFTSQGHCLRQAFVVTSGQQFYLPFLLAGIGMVGIGRCLKGSQAGQHPMILSLSLFSVVQLLLMPNPYKQYLCSVYLGWSAALALAFYQLLGWNQLRGMAVLSVLTVASLISSSLTLWKELRGSLLTLQRETSAQLLELVPPGGKVVSLMTLHPLFREDGAFVFITSQAPGPVLVKTMQQLRPEDRRFTAPGLLEEMRASRPVLVARSEVQQDPAVLQAVEAYLGEQAASYRLISEDSQVRVYLRGTP